MEEDKLEDWYESVKSVVHNIHDYVIYLVKQVGETLSPDVDLLSIRLINIT